MSFNLNPVPNVIYFLAPLFSFSPKYPNLSANESSYVYSIPKARVISFNSSLKPSGASPKDLNNPDKKFTSS